MRPAISAVLSAAAFALFVNPAAAIEVLFVDAETPDPGWQSLIEGGGHTFTLFDTGTYNLSLNNQDSIDYVEGFDVIVMSGSNAAFNALRSHGATWNTLPTPLLILGNYLISGQYNSSSWQWTTPTTSGTPNAAGDLDVLDESDLIWTGVTLTPGTPPAVNLFDASSGHLDLGTDSFLSGITTVAAQSANNLLVAIAHAAPDALRSGSQEQYFISGMTGGALEAEPYSAAGEQVFLNAIEALAYLPGPPVITELSPGNGATNVPLAADLVATFSRGVELTGTGTVVLRNLSAGSEVTIGLPDGQVSALGNRLTIDPTDDLALDTHYAVRISADAVKDSEDNPFAGILNDDDWDFFTTADATPPTLAPDAIVDDQGGATIDVNTLVTYTVTFSEDIDEASVGSDDFGNAGTAAIGIESITGIAPGVFRIEVIPTSLGSLQLQVLAGAVITDHVGNPLDTSSAIVAETALNVVVPNDFGTWIDGFSLLPAEKDFGGDPDGDGLASGIESWLGTHPGQPNAGLAVLSATGLTTTFNHPRNPDPPDDVTAVYQWSPDLANWYPDGGGPAGGPTVSFVPVPAGTTTTVTATASEPLDRLFLRAAVNRDVSVADLQRDFRELGFGMFIHYNMATYQGVEWVADYHSPADFNPGGTIDTDAWADAAVSAGMTYGVLTAKHVAGFCLWDSAYTTYDVMHPDCPYQKDIVAQFIESFTSRGLKVGLYYCWRHPGFSSTYKVLPPECDPATHSFAEQIAFQKAQIAELIARYPEVFYIWNDALDTQVIPAAEALATIRGVRPDVLACSNWWDWGKKGTPFLDIAVKELNHFPVDNQAPGETCYKLEGAGWFWKSNSSPGSATGVVGNINTAWSRNSNFLLNVGPDTSGSIIPASVQRLAEIGSLLQQQ